MPIGPAGEKREKASSALGWMLVALGLLSPILAGVLASVFLGDPGQSADAEVKGYVFLVAGLLVGLVLIVAGLIALLGNRLSSEARQPRGEALPGVEAAARAPRPWTVAGLVVASVGWVFVGSYGPLLGLVGGALAAIGGAKGERNAGTVMLYALVVTIITLFAPVWLS